MNLEGDSTHHAKSLALSQVEDEAMSSQDCSRVMSSFSLLLPSYFESFTFVAKLFRVFQFLSRREQRRGFRLNRSWK